MGRLAVNQTVVPSLQELRGSTSADDRRPSTVNLILQVDAKLHYQQLVHAVDACTTQGGIPEGTIDKMTFVELQQGKLIRCESIYVVVGRHDRRSEPVVLGSAAPGSRTALASSNPSPAGDSDPDISASADAPPAAFRTDEWTAARLVFEAITDGTLHCAAERCRLTGDCLSGVFASRNATTTQIDTRESPLMSS